MEPQIEDDTALRVREGFPKQRLIILPANIIKRCQSFPLVRDIYITHIGAYPTAPHHYVGRPKGVHQAVLIYCLDGAGILELDNLLFEVRPGHLLIIPPDTPHIYRAAAGNPWSLFWIHFSGRQTAAVLQNLGASLKNPLLYIPDTALMRAAFEDVYACLNYHYSDAGLLAMTGELIRLLSRIKLHQNHPLPQGRASENRILSTLKFMEQHLNMPLTLEALAANSGQSVSHFSKLFKARTNQAPLSYFIQLKIRKACELLNQTDLRVGEIARELGYDDPYYFSRIFKKIQGCSPAHYRRSARG